jgi:phospholipase A1
LESPADLPADLWFGYTQQSFWQAANHDASSPFRESNYQPELMAVVPTSLDLFGIDVRFLNIGLVHQSNGQTSTLSRSWNRVYLQTGLEHGDFSLLARVWKRFDESAASDNNPDIVDYMGHGDLIGTYRWHGHEFTALARHNFRTSKGALQLGWAFPLSGKLSGYVQLFSGYGQSLIDYNDAQKVIGLGVLINP